MFENLGATIAVPINEYKELLKAKFRIETMESFVRNSKYLDKEDMARILGIEVPKDGEE